MIKNLNDLEIVQQEEWSRVEDKVESTLLELKNIRQENGTMLSKIDDLNQRNSELEEKMLEIRTKYKAKKGENSILKEKCMKLTHALAKVENDNNEIIQYLSMREKHETKIQKKMKVKNLKKLNIFKAIEDVKGMIGVYRQKFKNY